MIDEVSLELARSKNWVASYEIYNWGIELSPNEQQEYDVIYGKQSKLMKYMAVFNYDIHTIIQCSIGNKPRFNSSTHYWFDPPSVHIARNMGWRGNNAVRARTIQQNNQTAPRGSKQSIWGGDNDHVYHPNKIVGYAVQARKLIAERKKFICNHYLKTNAVLEAYNLLQLKTISFTETKDAAKEIHERVGNKSVLYHSQMDSVASMVTKTKEYKRRASVDKYIAKHPDITFDVTEENSRFIISWQKEKFVGEKFQKKEALRKLTDNRYKINFISSVKSLNEGVDIPDLELALIHSRNSTPRDTIQRIGRVARLFIYKDKSEKKPIIVNIYLKNTKDEDWLRNAMKKTLGAIWIDNLSQMTNLVQFKMIS